MSLLWVSILAFALSAPSRDNTVVLPELHRIRTVTLSPSYSCRPAAVAAKGYQNSALFLSTPPFNAPDLLFNGACGSPNYFQAATAGADFGFIADLGESLPLESLSADQARNVSRIACEAKQSTFTDTALVRIGHTYAVIEAHAARRALFFFTVVAFQPSESVTLRYAVKLYEVFPPSSTRSAGFSWSQKSTE